DVTVRELNLDEVVTGGPKSNLQMSLKAKGGGTSLSTLNGEVHLSVPPSQVSGETLGPVEVHATADRGRFSLPSLKAVLPGVSVQAHGEGTVDHVSLSGK